MAERHIQSIGDCIDCRYLAVPGIGPVSIITIDVLDTPRSMRITPILVADLIFKGKCRTTGMLVSSSRPCSFLDHNNRPLFEKGENSLNSSRILIEQPVILQLNSIEKENSVSKE